MKLSRKLLSAAVLLLCFALFITLLPTTKAWAVQTAKTAETSFSDEVGLLPYHKYRCD